MKELKELLAKFHMLCGDILLGKAEKKDIEEITKAMCDAGQAELMGEEFKKIGITLADPGVQQ